MKKSEFLQTLKSGLTDLPESDINERVSFYSDMIDDRIEEGIQEEEAVAQVGDPKDVINEILSDVSPAKVIKENKKPKKTLKWWAIVLIILGAPLWLALILAGASIILALVAVVFSILIGLFGVDIALGVSGIACALSSIFQFIGGNAASGIMSIGIGLIAVGLSLFMFIGCFELVKLLIKAIKAIVIGIKKSFREEKNEQRN